jgi:hypothetical protein
MIKLFFILLLIFIKIIIKLQMPKMLIIKNFDKSILKL